MLPLLIAFATYLAQQKGRRPFWLARTRTCSAALTQNAAAAETLRKSKRKARLTITGASPLSCVKLFTRGKQLRKMAWMQLVHSCTDGHVTYQLQQVHSVRPFPAALPSCL